MKTESFKIKLDPKTFGEYEDYIGYLFESENGKYNLPKTEEDIMKSNQWFKNLPIKVAILSLDVHQAMVNEKYMFVGLTNESLNGKIFEIKNINTEMQTVDMIDVENRKPVITTIHAFPARKFVRWANDEDKKNIVDSQTIDYERI